MRNIFTILILLLATISVQAQSRYPLTINISPVSTWKLSLDTITAKEFDQTKVVWQPERKTNSDSLLKVLTKLYPQAITCSDSCHTLHARDTVLQLCRRQPADDKGATGYQALGIDHGFLLLGYYGYESWSHFGFNPQTRQYFLVPDEPCFIGNEFVYSAGNYYSEGEFMIWNLKTNKKFGFSLYNGELTASYRNENSIFFEITSKEKKKYLRLRYR